MPSQIDAIVASGPNLPFSPWPTATVQLHQTGHSSIALHFRKMKIGSADKAAVYLLIVNGRTTLTYVQRS